MRNIIDTIYEQASISGLKPVFYFSNMQFFDIVTDTEQQKYLAASIKRVEDNFYIYIYYKQKQIGYLKLKKQTQY